MTALLPLLALSCLTSPEQVAPPAANPRWPSPPEPARFVYQTTLRSSLDIQAPAREQRLRSLLTGSSAPDVRFGRPYAVAAQGGMIFVSDTRERLIHAFDIPRRRFFQFGFRLEGALKKPLGIAVDEQQRVYVVDGPAKRVVVYDRLGLFLRFIGSEHDLVHPTAVAVSHDGEQIYVADTGGVDSDQHCVVAYDASGAQRFVIGSRGTGVGLFNLPVGVAVAPDGTLFVLDGGNFRVQAFDSDGNYLRSWGSAGDQFGQFARPKAIATDAAGRVYVVDALLGNVQVFDSEGNLLLPVGQLSMADKPGHYALPIGLALDEAGYLYVLDQVFGKVDVIRRLETAVEPDPARSN